MQQSKNDRKSRASLDIESMGLSDLMVLRLKVTCIRYDLMDIVGRLGKIDECILAEQQKQMRERRDRHAFVDNLGKLNGE